MSARVKTRIVLIPAYSPIPARYGRFRNKEEADSYALSIELTPELFHVRPPIHSGAHVALYCVIKDVYAPEGKPEWGEYGP